MPTDAEIEAVESAVDVQRYHRCYHTNRDIALAALAAAEAVRQQAQRRPICPAHRSHLYTAWTCNQCNDSWMDGVAHPCPLARDAYAETSKAILAVEVADQRMTQTHAPLASHVQWSLPGDPTSYEPIDRQALDAAYAETDKRMRDATIGKPQSSQAVCQRRITVNGTECEQCGQRTPAESAVIPPCPLQVQADADLAAARTKYRATAGEQACGCWRCTRERNDTVGMSRFVVCHTCGNKRCPHANDHHYTCTNSNEPGQPGSAYPPMPTAVDLSDPDLPLMSAATNGPQVADTQPPRKDYHTSGIPGDAVGNADGLETEPAPTPVTPNHEWPRNAWVYIKLPDADDDGWTYTYCR